MKASQRPHLFFWIILFSLGFQASAQQIDTLAFQDFELTPQAPVWNYTGTPNAFLSGFSSATATPANSPLGINGSRAWHLVSVSGGNPVVFVNQTIPGIYDSIRVRFRLAAMNLIGTTGGPDNLDYVLVSYSTDGGNTFVDRLRVRGAVANNCSWPYSAASTARAYYLPASEVVFQPQNSGLQLQDGLGTVELVFPGSISQLSVRLTPRSSSSSDSWLIDNLVLVGEASCSPSSATISATDCGSYLSPSGNIYTSSGTYQDTIPNAAQCDSVITINLTLLNSAQTISETACDSYLSPSGNTYTSSGTYQDTIPNAAQCDSVITINLTVNSSTASTITETACFSYLSPSGNTFSQSGTYLDTIPNAALCDSVITINLTINTADTSVSQSGITLTANASAATYQWIDCQNGNQAIPGETGQSYTPTATGSYAVVVTQNACTDTSGCRNVTVVGLDAAWATGLSIWPNPATEKMWVKMGASVSGATLRIFDARGRKMITHTMENAPEFELPLAPLAAGIYLLEVEVEGQKVFRKFVKE